MEVPTKIIGFIGSGFAAVATLYGGATFTHDKLQQIDSMDYNIMLLDMRLESKILEDRFALLQQRIRDIEGRYGRDLFEAPGAVIDQYRIMTNELNALDRELSAVQQEYRRQGNSSNGYYERSRGLKVE